MSAKIAAYIQLTHPWAVTIVMIATTLFGLLAARADPPIGRFALLFTGMLGGQIAIGATNEWCDRHVDAIDKPHRPIPAGLVPASGALALAAFGLLAMTVAGLALGVWGFLLLVIMIGAGLVYYVKLKRTPWSWLPYLVALPLVPTWAWVVMDEFQPGLLWLYPLGALFVLAIHMSQTLPDIGADASRGEQGIGVVLGRRWAEASIWLAAFGSTLAVAAGGWVFGSAPLPTTIAAGVVAVVLAVAFVAARVAGPRVQPHLFKILTSSAVILATGWVLTVTD